MPLYYSASVSFMEIVKELLDAHVSFFDSVEAGNIQLPDDLESDEVLYVTFFRARTAFVF